MGIKEEKLKEYMNRRMDRIKQSDVMELMIVNGARETEREGVLFNVVKTGIQYTNIDLLEDIIADKREVNDMF